jgi:hypothetical protein
MQDRICQIDENLLHPTAGPYIRVKSVALCNGRLHLDFRYTLLATKLARDCNMSRWAKRRLPGKGLHQVQCGDFL